MSIRPQPSYNNPGNHPGNLPIPRKIPPFRTGRSHAAAVLLAASKTLCGFLRPLQAPKVSTATAMALRLVGGPEIFFRKREGKYRVTHYLDVPLEVRINVEKKVSGLFHPIYIYPILSRL